MPPISLDRMSCEHHTTLGNIALVLVILATLHLCTHAHGRMTSEVLDASKTIGLTCLNSGLWC